MSQQTHIIPTWTYWACPLALLTMIMTPWSELNATDPDAAPLLLSLLAIGNAIVIISIVHWVKSALGGLK